MKISRKKTFLNKVQNLVLTKPDLFIPEWSQIMSLVDVIVDVSPIAAQFLQSNEIHTERLQKWVLARPRYEYAEANPLWFEYEFPNKLSEAGGKLRVGALCYWTDNESDTAPQTLDVMLICESGEPSLPLLPVVDISLDIGMDGRIFGDMDREAVFRMIQLTPIFAQINDDHQQE